MLRSTLIAGAILLAQCSLNSAEADIILEVSDDGTDLTLKWTGTMDVGVTGGADSSMLDFFRGGSSEVLSLDGSSFSNSNVGSTSGNNPWRAGNRINRTTTGVGAGFGFASAELYWDDSFGATPGVISPDREWTIFGRTVATAFGTNLDAGPVLLWTHNTTGDTISVGLASSSSAAVPEPSSFALLGLGGIGFLVRRRRKSRADAQAESHCAASEC